MIQDRQCEGFQNDAFSEGSPHGEHRGSREVQLTLAVAVDVATKSIRGQVLACVIVQKVGHRFQFFRSESEFDKRLEQSGGTGDDAVPAAVRQSPGEYLEGGLTSRGAVTQCGGKHGELVLVGEQ